MATERHNHQWEHTENFLSGLAYLSNSGTETVQFMLMMTHMYLLQTISIFVVNMCCIVSDKFSFPKTLKGEGSLNATR